jgi:hypothetical protein
MSLAQNLGITFALAISGAVFREESIESCKRFSRVLSKDELRGAITGNDSSVITRLDDVTIAKAIHAIVTAISHTYFLVVTADVIAVIGSAYLKVSYPRYLFFHSVILCKRLMFLQRDRIFIKAAGAA